MPINNTAQANANHFFETYKKDPSRIIIFIGAGLSIPLFPSWTSFLEKLVNYCSSRGRLHFEKDLLLNMLNEGESFLDIATTCVDCLGPADYRGFLEEHFDKDFSLEQIPPAYKEIFNLPINNFITTNYDHIPNKLGGGNFKVFSNLQISEASRAITSNKKTVVKIHGDIDSQDSIILTRKEFENIIHNRLDVRNFLNTTFSSKIVLFLGFSLSDPHFDLILTNLHAINSEIPITHYALMTTNSSKDFFKVEMLEKKYGMKIISYSPSDKTHKEVVEFIKSLSDLQTIEPLPQQDLSVSEFSNYIADAINLITGNSPLVISFDDKDSTIFISLISRSVTPSEFQREFLILIENAFSFETTKLKRISIRFQDETLPNSEWHQFCPTIYSCGFSFEAAHKLAAKMIDFRQFWTSVSFYVLDPNNPSIPTLTPFPVPFIGSVL